MKEGMNSVRDQLTHRSGDGVGEWSCPLTMCIYGSATPCFLICIAAHPSPKQRVGLIISLISGSKVTWGALSCPFMDLVCLLLLLPCSLCKKSRNSSRSSPSVMVDPPKNSNWIPEFVSLVILVFWFVFNTIHYYWKIQNTFWANSYLWCKKYAGRAPVAFLSKTKRGAGLLCNSHTHNLRANFNEPLCRNNVAFFLNGKIMFNWEHVENCGTSSIYSAGFLLLRTIILFLWNSLLFTISIGLWYYDQ